MGRPFQLSTFIMDFLERELVLNIPQTSHFLRTQFFPQQKNKVSFKTKTDRFKKCACFMWFLAEFAWDSYGLPLSINAHAPRYPHQCLQLNDSLPSAGQGGHISSGTKQQTLQPPGSYPFLPLGRVSKIILPFEIHPLNH